MEHQQPGEPQPPAVAPMAGPVDAPPGRRKAAWIGMGALLVALVLLAFLSGPSGIDHDAPPPAADGSTPGADPEDGKSAGKPAPLQFTLKDMNGVDVALSSFKGKVILLNFWATWCGPCRAEIPSLVELQKEYPNDLVVLGFSVDDPVEKLQPYAKEFQINYPILVGLGREDVQDAYGPLWGIPVSVIIAPDGTIQKKHSGIATKEQFEREIRTALGV
jgi:thiol-disulfide isomerase/thioredoxin